MVDHLGPWKEPSLAASRTASPMSTARTASGRLSFAKIREPLEVPDLLALQTESFDWLLGNERWQERVAAAAEHARPRAEHVAVRALAELAALEQRALAAEEAASASAALRSAASTSKTFSFCNSVSPAGWKG